MQTLLARLVLLALLLLPVVAKAEVLIYAGLGTWWTSALQAQKNLQALLGPQVTVRFVNAAELNSGTWTANTLALVMPGGRDVFYDSALKNAAATHIKAYVHAGGRYLGLCAGGYFAAEAVHFAPRKAALAVHAPRPLSFFPGPCVGPWLADFDYQHDAGAALLRLSGADAVLQYYHGGGAFVPRDSASHIHVLARYPDAAQQAAIVWLPVGRGSVLLTGTHPEIPLSLATRNPDVQQQQRQLNMEVEEKRRQAYFTQLWHILLQAKL